MSLTREQSAQEFMLTWQDEEGYSDEEMVARLMLILYQHLRGYELMRATGFDWNGRDLEGVGMGIEALTYMLGIDPESLAEEGMQEFIAWRVQRLNSMPYREYLKTPEWQTVRYFAHRRARGRCQVCNGTYRLEVHHRDYTRRGAELIDDVTVLCRKHHQLFHSDGRLSG